MMHNKIERVIVVRLSKSGNVITSYQEYPTNLYLPILPNMVPLASYPSFVAIYYGIDYNDITIDKTNMEEVSTISN